MLVACLMVLDLFLVHVAVGFGEDGVDVVDGCAGEGVAEGDADACSAEAVVELGANIIGLRVVLDFFDHEEFVASHAEDGVCGAGGLQETGGGLDERVACLMAEVVVRLFEAIEVAEEEGVRSLLGQALQVVEQPRRFMMAVSGSILPRRSMRRIRLWLRSRMEKKRASACKSGMAFSICSGAGLMTSR